MDVSTHTVYACICCLLFVCLFARNMAVGVVLDVIPSFPVTFAAQSKFSAEVGEDSK